MIDDVDQRLLAARERSTAADVIAEVFNPPIVVVALLTAVSFRASPDLRSALGWIALTATFCAGIPYLLLLWSVRAGHASDRHLVRRFDRRRPLVTALVSVLIGLALLAWLDAPRPITALVAAFVAGLVVMLPLTVRWKASIHAAVVAGALAITAATFGTVWAIALGPALPLVAWARTRAGRHTVAQVVIGVLVGAFVASTTFGSLR